MNPENPGGGAEEGSMHQVSLACGPCWAGSRAGRLGLEAVSAENTHLGLKQTPPWLGVHSWLTWTFISGQCNRIDQISRYQSTKARGTRALSSKPWESGTPWVEGTVNEGALPTLPGPVSLAHGLLCGKPNGSECMLRDWYVAVF